MAAKIRGCKTEFVGVRLTPRQLGKLEKLAIIRDATISDVVRELVDGVTVDVSLPHQRSNPSGHILADATGIAL